MKTITHQFGVELNWIEQFSYALEGYHEGINIFGSQNIFEGTRCAFSITPDISVMLTDGVYKQDVSFVVKNASDDFVWVWYNLNEEKSQFNVASLKTQIGRWNFNSVVVDGKLNVNYVVKKNTNTYSLIIFIKKEMIKNHLVAKNQFKKVFANIFNVRKNTIFSSSRMSPESLFLIEEFRGEIKNSKSNIDLFLSALTFNLISDYLDNYFMQQNIAISKINVVDVEAIIDSQEYILQDVKTFPGITELSDRAKMSETKYKKMFLKITGLTPNLFYQNNKLRISKKMLESQKYTVGEIVEILNYSTSSHFAKQFKNFFGMFPKEYMLLMR